MQHSLLVVLRVTACEVHSTEPWLALRPASVNEWHVLGTTGAGVIISCSGPAAATPGCTGTATGAGRGSTACTSCSSLRPCDLQV
jgi:hypothetical protein